MLFGLKNFSFLLKLSLSSKAKKEKPARPFADLMGAAGTSGNQIICDIIIAELFLPVFRGDFHIVIMLFERLIFHLLIDQVTSPKKQNKLINFCFRIGKNNI